MTWTKYDSLITTNFNFCLFGHFQALHLVKPVLTRRFLWKYCRTPSVALNVTDGANFDRKIEQNCPSNWCKTVLSAVFRYWWRKNRNKKFFDIGKIDRCMGSVVMLQNEKRACVAESAAFGRNEMDELFPWRQSPLPSANYKRFCYWDAVAGIYLRFIWIIQTDEFSFVSLRCQWGEVFSVVTLDSRFEMKGALSLGKCAADLSVN